MEVPRMEYLDYNPDESEHLEDFEKNAINDEDERELLLQPENERKTEKSNKEKIDLSEN
jgi:hypothetical protein